MDSAKGSSNSKPHKNFLQFGHLNHQYHRYRSSALVKITLILLTAGVGWLGLNQSTYISPCYQRSYLFVGTNDGSVPSTDSTIKANAPTVPVDLVGTNDGSVPSTDSTIKANAPTTPKNTKVNDEALLETILKNASMGESKTVIITTLNAAWTKPNSLFDLFLKSFKIGNQTEHLLNHLVVTAFDQKAYSRCLEVHKHCYPLATENIDFSSEAHYMSRDYLKMMWRRTDFLLTILELGYSFVFTDADIMWLRDPFPRFYPDADFQIACDNYIHNSKDLKNSPNGGFKYVRANKRTIQFYKFWNMGKNFFHGQNEQDVLNIIKFYPYIQEIRLEMRFLDTAYFGGFCEPSKDLDLVITMHANCCIGMENKIHDIKMLIADWTNYMALPSGERNLRSRSWTVPRVCG